MSDAGDVEREYVPDDEPMMLPFSAFREAGLLWLVNRVVFHPRGYALAFQLEDDGSVSGWMLLGDGDEVWTFQTDDDDEMFDRVKEILGD